MCELQPCFLCNRKKQRNPAIIFHRFPKYEDRCYKWISSLQDHPDGKYLKNISPPQLNKTYRICSSHFSLKNYQGNKLLKVAIPDQNMCEEASGSCTMGNDSGSDGNSSWNTFYFGIPSDLPGHSSEEEISVTSNNYEKVQPSIPPCPEFRP
nr:uncharacterized protein LOC113806811 [Penaeus vannamei]